MDPLIRLVHGADIVVASPIAKEFLLLGRNIHPAFPGFFRVGYISGLYRIEWILCARIPVLWSLDPGNVPVETHVAGQKLEGSPGRFRFVHDCRLSGYDFRPIGFQLSIFPELVRRKQVLLWFPLIRQIYVSHQIAPLPIASQSLHTVVTAIHHPWITDLGSPFMAGGFVAWPCWLVWCFVG